MACSVQRFLGYNFKEKHRTLRGNSIILSPVPKTQLLFQQHAVAHVFTWPPVSGLRFALWCIMLHFPVQLLFVRPHNLVNLLTLFDKQERRHCTDFPCWCHILHRSSIASKFKTPSTFLNKKAIQIFLCLLKLKLLLISFYKTKLVLIQLGQLRNILCPIYRTFEKRSSNSQVSRDSTLKDQLQDDNCSMWGKKNKKKLTGTSSTSTLRKIKPGYFLLSSMKIGDIMRHGPHQVAVKSTTICLQTPKIFESSFNVKCMWLQ